MDKEVGDVEGNLSGEVFQFFEHKGDNARVGFDGAHKGETSNVEGARGMRG